MGFMTTAVILNDQLYQIERDPNFGKRLVAGVHEMFGRGELEICGQACTLVDQHHADTTAVLAVGGNYTTRLGYSWTYQHHRLEDQEFILKQILNDVQRRLKEKQEITSNVSKV